MEVWLAWVEYWDRMIGVFDSEAGARRAARENCSKHVPEDDRCPDGNWCHVDGPYVLNREVAG